MYEIILGLGGFNHRTFLSLSKVVCLADSLHLSFLHSFKILIHLSYQVPCVENKIDSKSLLISKASWEMRSLMSEEKNCFHVLVSANTGRRNQLCCVIFYHQLTQYQIFWWAEQTHMLPMVHCGQIWWLRSCHMVLPTCSFLLYDSNRETLHHHLHRCVYQVTAMNSQIFQLNTEIQSLFL